MALQPVFGRAAGFTFRTTKNLQFCAVLLEERGLKKPRDIFGNLYL